MMSGGPIRKFTEGWAVRVFGFGKAHYFKRNEAGLAFSLCGGSCIPVVQLRGLGSWTKCKRCESKAPIVSRET
jgi:hypothetical protein